VNLIQDNVIVGVIEDGNQQNENNNEGQERIQPEEGVDRQNPQAQEDV